MDLFRYLFGSKRSQPRPPAGAKITIFAGVGPIGPFLLDALSNAGYAPRLVHLIYPSSPVGAVNGWDVANPYNFLSLLSLVEEGGHAIFVDPFLAKPSPMFNPADYDADAGFIYSGLKFGYHHQGTLSSIFHFMTFANVTVWHPRDLVDGLALSGEAQKGSASLSLQRTATDVLTLMRGEDNASYASTVFFDEQRILLADGCRPIEHMIADVQAKRKLSKVCVLRAQVAGAPPEIQTPCIDNALLEACSAARLAGIFYEARTVLRAPDLDIRRLERGFLIGV